MQESGGDPTAQNSIGASGLAQWLGGRKNSLDQFAASRGTTWQDMDTQIAFLLHELQTTERGAWEKIQAAYQSGGPEAATIAISRHFERPGAHEANEGRRVEYQQQGMSMYGGFLQPLMQEMMNKPAGSQLAVANTSETVLNQDQTAMLASALKGGRGQFHITINTAGSSPAAIADAVAGAIDEAINRAQSFSFAS